MFHRWVGPDDGKILPPGKVFDPLHIHRQQLQHPLHLLRDPGEIHRHRDAVIMGRGKRGLVGIVLQRTKGKIPGRHVAVLMLSKQTLAPAFPAVIHFHHIRRRFLILIAVGHMHVIVHQLHPWKHVVARDISHAALVFQMKAVAGIAVPILSPDSSPVQVNARKPAGKAGHVLPARHRFQNMLCQLVWVVHRATPVSK